jgi:transcriptional regulator with XRE-family HTH domain
MTETLPEGLTLTLRQARAARRLSQLELSMRLGVSQRHVSFVESGRARPSRGLLLQWLEELGAALPTRNAALMHAGYAPAFSAAPLSDPELARAAEAMQHLLHAHDPMPAMVVDAEWNVLRANSGAVWLLQTLAPTLLPTMTSMNMLDVLAHPEGIARVTLNLAEVAAPMLAQLREEAAAQPQLSERVQAVAARFQERLGTPTTRDPRTHSTLNATLHPTPPVLVTRFATPYGVLSFFTMLTTFGTPQSITLASLRIEHMFAADDRTRDVLSAHVTQS